MVTYFRLLLGYMMDCFRSHERLKAEILILRHQLNILQSVEYLCEKEPIRRAVMADLANIGRAHGLLGYEIVRHEIFMPIFRFFAKYYHFQKEKK